MVEAGIRHMRRLLTHHFSARRGSCSIIEGLRKRPTTAPRHAEGEGSAVAQPKPRPLTTLKPKALEPLGPFESVVLKEEGDVARPRRRCARFGPRCPTFSSRRSRMQRRTVRSCHEAKVAGEIEEATQAGSHKPLASCRLVFTRTYEVGKLRNLCIAPSAIHRTNWRRHEKRGKMLGE